MELLSFCAISLYGFLAILILVRITSFVTDSVDYFGAFVLKNFVYPYIVDRHRLCGPWSRANVILCGLYAIINVFFVTFQARSVEMAGRRAGSLSVINMALLIPTTHSSFFASIIGVSLIVCRRIHRVVGWMTAILLCFHVILIMSSKENQFDLGNKENLFPLLVLTLYFY